MPHSSGQLIGRSVRKKEGKCVSYIDQFEGVWQGGKRGCDFPESLLKIPASRLEKSRHMVQVAREATDYELRANIINQEGGF